MGKRVCPPAPSPNPWWCASTGGEHAVKNVPVNFELQTPGAGAALLYKGSPLSNPVYTEPDGTVEVTWRLGSDRAVRSQQVLAYIDAPGDARQHLQVRFNANLSLAEEVSYEPPNDCPNLAGTSTVAEALDALCTISADQVTYEPPADCPNLEGATNVAEALDALCNISGGGCCVCVGPDGDFPDLDTALNELMRGEVREICLCLAAGPYSLKGFQHVHRLQDGEFHLRISGCGPGTLIDLQEPFRLNGATSFHLEEVAIQTSFVVAGPFGALAFEGCEEVSLTGCNIAGRTAFDETEAGGTLLSIGSTASVRLRDLRLEADTEPTYEILIKGLDEVGAEIIRDAIIVAVEDPSLFLEAALNAGQIIADLDEAQRIDLSRQINDLRTTQNVWSEAELFNFQKLRFALQNLERPPEDYAAILVDLRRAVIKSRPGCALVLSPLPTVESAEELIIGRVDRDNFVSIESCEIAGEVGLYGLPVTPTIFDELLPDDELKKLQNDIKDGSLTIPSNTFPLGTLEMRGNQIARLGLARNVVEAFANRFDISTVFSLYNEVLLTDNIFESEPIIVAALHCGLAGNQFLTGQRQIVGVVFGNSGVYTGNRGSLSPSGAGQMLWDITRFRGDAANVLINIA